MTFDEWMLTVAPGHKQSDDSVSLRILRKCWSAAMDAERERYETALRIAREGYASEAVTGLPVLPKWRERTMALIDGALSGGSPNTR